MQTVDLGGGRGWAAPDAAASIIRVDAQLGRTLQITEAGRTYERQAKLRADWEQRKPGAAFALPPDPPEGPSEHQSGEAIDTDEWVNANVVRVLNDNGWFQTAIKRGERWHFDYFRDRDNHLEDDMPTAQEIADAVWNYGIGEDDGTKLAAQYRLRGANRTLDDIAEFLTGNNSWQLKMALAHTPIGDGSGDSKRDRPLWVVLADAAAGGPEADEVLAQVLLDGLGEDRAKTVGQKLVSP